MFQMEDITPRYVPEEKLTRLDDQICDTQADLFVLAMQTGFDMKDFTEKYMNSRFCNMEMDNDYSRMQLADEDECLELLLTEIHPLKRAGGGCHDKSMIKWIGWMYRYMSMRYGIASRHIHERLPFDKMCIFHEGMHTQDDEYVIDVFSRYFPERRR